MMLHRHFDGKEKRIIEPPKILPKSVIKDNGMAIAYSGTQNLYPDMLPAIKSALRNSPVDDIFLLIETDAFPYAVPSCVHCVNVSNQQWFNRDSLNYNTHWTYMVLMKLAPAKLLLHHDRVLFLDVDTLVVNDITPLWELDMSDSYFGCVPEHAALHSRNPYFNVGVSIQNLALLRETGMADNLIHKLNTRAYTYPEQDAINQECRGHILTLDVKYNDSFCCGYSGDPAIVHFAGRADWQNWGQHTHYHYLSEYRSMPWEAVAKGRYENYGLTLEF